MAKSEAPTSAEEIARLKAELAAAEARAMPGGVITATTVGNGSAALMLNRDDKSVTDEQKTAEEFQAMNEEVYGTAGEQAAAEAKAQAESRQAAEEARLKAEDEAAKAAKAQADAQAKANKP